ncbi:MAG: hypothetical protein O2855_00995 [Planctomycetota bacterium]|nr:hypothetical protein [Planctomycetota bacterium]
MTLQIITLVFIALIAYWWANQGTFSAFLHLTCVILAGALTFAFWEPLSVMLLPSLKDHAWSVSFLGLFAILLLVFRVAFDRLAPGNLNFPQWVNYVFGGAFGAAAGVLTVGMLIIGMGFTQSLDSLLGFYGWTRVPENRGQPYESQRLFLPAHQLTAGFFGMLSGGSLSPIKPTGLRDYYPDLARTALSLHRDSWDSGQGKTSVNPADIKVTGFFFDESYGFDDGTRGAYSLRLSFTSSAFDRGQGLTLSASQARLVGATTGGKRRESVYPVKFVEDVAGGSRGTFAFDDVQCYATNPSGQQSAEVDLIFPKANLADVRFAMVKGLRLSLPVMQSASIVSQQAAGSSSARVPTLSSDGAPELAASDLSDQNSVSPLRIGINQASGLDIREEKKGNWIEGGKGDFKKTGTFSVSRGQRVTGFVCPPDTAIVRLDVSRDIATVDLDRLRKDLLPGERLLLVDDQDRGYAAAGYVWDRGEDVQVAFDPVQLFPKISDFPATASSGTHRLWAVFIVPVGVTIKQVRVGQTVVGAGEFLIKGLQ